MKQTITITVVTEYSDDGTPPASTIAYTVTPPPRNPEEGIPIVFETVINVANLLGRQMGNTFQAVARKLDESKKQP